MKKLLSLLLAVMLLASCIPAFADATWTISDSGALKVNSDVKLSGEVVIPETVDGIPVTSLDGFAFNNQNDVTSIVMPDTIQSMSGSAINFLNGLTSVKLSENLQIIGDMNFTAMKGLTSLTIPASVCFIGDAMSSLSNLETLTFEGVCPMFKLSEPITGLNRNCVIYVPDDQVDAYKTALTNGYGTEEQVQASGKNAVIYDNPAAESEFEFDAATGTITGYTGTSARLQIPAAIGGVAVKAIGEKAFSRNAAICYVIIPEGVETIGNYAFENCDELVVVNFPTTLKKIGDGAFDGCYLSSVGWSEGLEEIGANAFARYGVQNLALPTTVKTIGEAAFKNGSIRKLYIGNAIESIGPEAFANNFLDRVELLTDRMIQIDETAFVGNTNETYVYLRWNVPYDVYKDYEHLFLNIYEGSTYLYIQAPIKDTSLGLEYPTNGTDSYNQDVWVSYNGTQPNLMTWYSWNRIPITTLGDGLFKGNQTIKSWYCSHEFTMHHIGNEAFADSSVEFVDLYHEIYTIGEHAFRNCVNIKEITLPETLTSIAANAFEGCTGLEKITILCDPSIIPVGLLDTCTALTEISAGENATAEQNQLLQFALYGMPEVTITQQPVDMIVAEGEMATATVQAEGESLTYAWYYGKDGNFNLSEDNTSDTYSVEMNDERSGRQVYCVVTDAYGTSATSETVTLSMNTPLKLKEEPEDVTAEAGEMAKMYVEARGDGLTYAWYVNDAPVEGCTAETFELEMSADYDGAEVYCVVTDAYGNSVTSEKAVLTLKIVVPFEITAQPTDVELPAGEMTNITVEATGEGLTYQWYVELSDESEFKPADGFTTNVYSVTVDETSDWSRVYCEITDASGSKLTSDKVSIFMAAPEVVVPEGEVDPGMVGHWETTKADMGGAIFDKTALEENGLFMWIDLNADGTAAMLMEGEVNSELTWSVAEGMLNLVYQGEALPLEIGEDGSICMEVFVFEKQGDASTEPVENEPTEPAAPAVVPGDASDFVGSWTVISGESEGVTLDKEMLEMIGMIITLKFNEDGTGLLAMEGEEGAINWSYADGAIEISVEGDSMTMTVNAEGTITGDFGGAFLTFAKDDAAEAPVEAPVDAPAASGDGIVGVWTDGSRKLEILADGTGVFTAPDGSTEDKTWTATETGCVFTDFWWSDYTAVLESDGSLTFSDGSYTNFNLVREGEAPVEAPAAEVNTEPFMGDWINPDMGDKLTINADGTLVLTYPDNDVREMTWTTANGAFEITSGNWIGDTVTIGEDGVLNVGGSPMKNYVRNDVADAPVDPAPEAPEASAGDTGFVGTWHMCYLSSGGYTGDMRPMGGTATLVLNEDGTGSFDYPEPIEGIWYEEDGFTYFGQGGDNADMPMGLLDGGFLQYGSDLGGYLILSQDANAVWDPTIGTAMIAPGIDATSEPVATEAPAEPAAPVVNASDVDMHDLLERKFVVKSYTSAGRTDDGSLLGAEYALFFREDGTCDFTLAGTQIPNLPWGLQKVAVGLGEVDAFVINYYGTMFNAVLTETGFDMDYYGYMTLHFVPAE